MGRTFGDRDHHGLGTRVGEGQSRGSSAGEGDDSSVRVGQRGDGSKADRLIGLRDIQGLSRRRGTRVECIASLTGRDLGRAGPDDGHNIAGDRGHICGRAGEGDRQTGTAGGGEDKEQLPSGHLVLVDIHKISLCGRLYNPKRTSCLMH